jgi:hypothetical protein
MVNRRGHQPHYRLKRRLARRRRMASARHKGLGAAKALSHACGIIRAQCAVQSGQIVLLLLFDVFREVGHEGLDGGEELWRAGLEILEFLELLFDL